jgi:hypothetical protein
LSLFQQDSSRVNNSGVIGGQFVATKEGFAMVAMQATNKGVAVLTLPGTPEVEGKLGEKSAEEEASRSPFDKY